MVHLGGPSKGCDTCRIRKVRCSLERPHCLRCEKGGFRCLGYLRRPRAELKQISHEISAGLDRGSKRSHGDHPSSCASSPLASISWPISDQSLNFFLHQFVVISQTNVNSGWFDFVPELLPIREASHTLATALDAVSMLSFAHRHHRQDLVVVALQLNGRALAAVNQALDSLVDAQKDSTFAAILLLCLFGHINGDLRLQVSMHAAGIFRLLALRSAIGQESPHTASFARHVVALLHLDNNNRYVAFTQPVVDSFALSMRSNATDDLFERLTIIWPYSAALSIQLHELMVPENTGSDKVVGLEAVKRGQEFDNILQKIAVNLDPAWHFYTGPGRSTTARLDSTIYPRRAIVYLDSWTMAIWHAFRITRISLHTNLANFFTVLQNTIPFPVDEPHQSSLAALRRRSLAIIDEMNEDICASIAWSLGELREHEDHSEQYLAKASSASLSIAGLRAVVNGMYARQEHVLQARAALDQIANQFGIKAALV